MPSILKQPPENRLWMNRGIGFKMGIRGIFFTDMQTWGANHARRRNPLA
jgi:hypothetical protein